MNMMGATNMMGYWNTGGFLWMGLLQLIYVAIIAFVFGIIFWFTYKLVIGNKKR